MRGFSLGITALAISGACLGAWADAVPPGTIVAPLPLSQMSNPPDRLTGARVIDPDGKVIGGVQKVEVRDGRPARLDIALLGSEKIVTLDASTVRYDALTNVLMASQSAGQLLARPQT